MGQLYYRNLSAEFFERFPRNTTEFWAVTGYVGPDPINRLLGLPFQSKVIYGLQNENRDLALHNQLIKIHCETVQIFYPSISTHSKCYLWLSEGQPLRGLVGSANFSFNGLNNDFRETLLEAERPDLWAVHAYIKTIHDSARACIDVSSGEQDLVRSKVQRLNSEKCSLQLYDPRSGQVQSQSGLNWGFADANVRPNDAYIPIRVEHIRENPHIFQPIFFLPDEGHRSRKHKESVELIWDDGTIMNVLFEGSQPFGGQSYPKQISSVPSKDTLGVYLRGRLGKGLVSAERLAVDRVTREDLERYGRDNIELSVIQPGVFFADFKGS